MIASASRQLLDQLRNVPLQAVLELAGATPDRQDKAKWHTARGTVSVTGSKFFNWNQNRGGGGAIDLVMHLNGLPFRPAIQWLADRFPYASYAASLRPLHTSALLLPVPDRRTLSIVCRYLLEQRRIPAVVLDPLVASGRIYADARANAVFLLLAQDGAAVGAELRGTGPQPWRGMAPGSRKDLGFFSTLPHNPTSIVLCESAIDALSCFVLNPRRLCISTAGARPHPRWLPALFQRALPIFCGFDSDPAGDTMARALIALHPTVQRLRPALHDWNDLLKAQS